MDVILQAGTGVAPGDGLSAGPVGEELLNQVHGLSDTAGGGKRPKIARAVLRHLAGYVNPGKVLGEVNLEVGVSLVVLQPGVEVGPVALNQGIFED